MDRIIVLRIFNISFVASLMFPTGSCRSLNTQNIWGKREPFHLRRTEVQRISRTEAPKSMWLKSNLRKTSSKSPEPIYEIEYKYSIHENDYRYGYIFCNFTLDSRFENTFTNFHDLKYSEMSRICLLLQHLPFSHVNPFTKQLLHLNKYVIAMKMKEHEYKFL